MVRVQLLNLETCGWLLLLLRNQLDFQLCPAAITNDEEIKAQTIAKRLVEEWQFVGLLAIEFFLDNNGEILISLKGIDLKERVESEQFLGYEVSESKKNELMRLAASVSEFEDIGCDEFIFVPTTKDLGHLEGLAEIVMG